MSPDDESLADDVVRTAVENVRWWHVWAGALAEQQPGEGQTRVHVNLGPTSMGPDHVGMDDKGIKIRDRSFPFSLIEQDPAKQGPELTYLASFNEEPDEDEIERLREEKGL